MRDIHKTSISKLTGLDRALYSGLGILLFITIISVAILSSMNSAASGYSASTTAAIHIMPTCSMSTDPNGTDTPHTASLVNGGVKTDIGITTIQTFCNDAGGYAIYAVGFTNNTIGSNILHNALDGSSTANDIATGTTLNGTVSNWAMKVASGSDGPAIQSDTSGSFASFHAVPNEFTLVAKYNNGVVSSENGSIMTTTYGASISRNQSVGTYVGQVKYVLVHPNSYTPGTYTIAYNANGGTGAMTSETNIVNYEPHTLATNTFTAPAGTIFGGWCTSNASINDCNSGMSYSDGQSVASLGSDGTTVTLYAYWLPTRPMQTFACSNMSVGESDYLYDTRDNNIYLVGKLADNNCWMLDNLRLDPTNSSTAANMTSSNTNAPAAAITNYLNGSSTAPQSGWSTTAVSNSAVNAWTNYYDVPQINTAWNKNNVSNDKDTVVGNHYGAGSGKRGTYYNFCAATAGTYCWASGAGKDLPDTIVDAPYDICPAGWHMPTGGVRKNDTEQVDEGEIGDYQTLCNILNGSNCTNGMSMTATNQNSLQYQLGLPLSGALASDTQYNYGSYGVWWSSTYYNGYDMYTLAVSSGSVWPMDDNARTRGYGFTMRCVAGS